MQYLKEKSHKTWQQIYNLKAYSSTQPSPFIIRKTHTVAQKQHERRLNTKVCSHSSKMPSGFLIRSAFNLSTMVFQKRFKFSLFSTKVMLITAWSSMSTQHLHGFKFALIESTLRLLANFYLTHPFFTSTGKLHMHEWLELNLWTSKQTRRWLCLEYATLNNHLWSSQAHARYSRSLYKLWLIANHWQATRFLG